MSPSHIIWAFAAVAVVLGWVVVYEEITARAEWRYRVALVAMWAAVTFVVGDWVVR